MNKTVIMYLVQLATSEFRNFALRTLFKLIKFNVTNQFHSGKRKNTKCHHKTILCKQIYIEIRDRHYEYN